MQTYLVARKPHPRLRHFLSKILNSGTTNKAQLSFDVQCTAKHSDKGDECNEVMNLQCEHYGDETHQHSDKRPRHTSGGVPIQARRRDCGCKFLVGTELVFDFSQNSLFII